MRKGLLLALSIGVATGTINSPRDVLRTPGYYPGDLPERIPLPLRPTAPSIALPTFDPRQRKRELPIFKKREDKRSFSVSQRGKKGRGGWRRKR